MNQELTTVLLAASPILELRGAIPFAIFTLGFPALKAYLLGILGSSLPVLPLLFFWNFLYEKAVHKVYHLNRFFHWLFERTRTKHANHFALWRDLALLIFVAIPLPFTGAWSGTVAAFVFGIPLKQALLSIVLGNVIAGLIVLLLSGVVSVAL